MNRPIPLWRVIIAMALTSFMTLFITLTLTDEEKPETIPKIDRCDYIGDSVAIKDSTRDMTVHFNFIFTTKTKDGIEIRYTLDKNFNILSLREETPGLEPYESKRSLGENHVDYLNSLKPYMLEYFQKLKEEKQKIPETEETKLKKEEN